MFPLVWGTTSAILVNLLECVHPVGRKAKICSYLPSYFFKWLCKPCKIKIGYGSNGQGTWVVCTETMMKGVTWHRSQEVFTW